MRASWSLLTWWLRPLLPLVVIIAAAGVAYAHLHPKPLTNWHSSWEGQLLLFASFFLAIPQSPIGGKAAFLYIYTRGYSRDAIWVHSLLATLLAVLLAWAPAALTVWTGARSAFQDRVAQSPYYPLMYSADLLVPLWWLLALLVLVPVFHYATVRLQQPTRGRFAGGVVAIAATTEWLGILLLARPQGQWFWPTVGLCAAILAVVMLFASLKLHRQMEVRQWAA